jgi:HemX protein
MGRILLLISCLCFLAGLAMTLVSLKTGRNHPRLWNRAAMAAGFLFQTLFLIERGRAIGHCPLTNLFEVLIFLSWSITLFYFLIGHTYRLSLLGGFTGPLVLLIQALALTVVNDPPAPVFLPHPAWVEWHAALSIMAYAAFALAGVAGVMYLAQERRLKTRKLGPAFYQMPPIVALATANLRLIWTGVALLTAGLASAWTLQPHMPPKIWIWGGSVWLVYLALALARRWGGPSRVARLSVVAFVAAAAALVLVGHFSPAAGTGGGGL